MRVVKELMKNSQESSMCGGRWVAVGEVHQTKKRLFDGCLAWLGGRV